MSRPRKPSSRRAPEEEPKREDIEIIREEARSAVERRGLREIASEIGMSHTGLRAFIAPDSERAPYGTIRWRLKRWAILRGLPLKDQSLIPPRASERAPATVPTVIPPRAYALIYDYTQLLARAAVPEEIIDEARRLMSGQTFNTLRAHMIDDRDEEGWVKDVKAAWALIKSELRRQGFDL